MGTAMVKIPYKFTCGEDLAEWLERKAETEQRPIASMIRVLLYEAKVREEERDRKEMLA